MRMELLNKLGVGTQDMIDNQMDTSTLRTNRLLRKDEWKAFDRAVVGEYLSRLQLVKLIKSKGLTYNYGDGLASTVLQWEEEVSQGGEAQMSMSGLERPDSQRPDYVLKSLPLPITYEGFQINTRLLAESRKLGRPIDTTIAKSKARNVAKKVEEVTLNGTSNFKYGTEEIYGITNHPDGNTMNISGAWNESAKSGADIVSDILSMKETLLDLNHYGPYHFLLPKSYELIMDEDYTSSYPKTIRNRLQDIGSIDGFTIVDKLPSDKIVCMEMKSDVVEMVEGLPLQVIEWEEQAGWVNFFRMITIEVPRVRSDANGNSGIVVATAT